MKIAVTQVISKSLIEKFISIKIDAVIYFKIEDGLSLIELSKKFKLINAFEDPVETNWFNYNLVTSKLEKLKRISPDIFFYKGFNLESGLNKDLFWSFIIKNSLLSQVESYKSESNEFLFYNQRSFITSKLALFKRLFISKHKSYSFLMNQNLSIYENKIFFRMNDLNLGNIYGNLFTKIDRHNLVSYQSSIFSKKIETDPYINKYFSENIKSEIIFKNCYKFKLVEKIKLFLTDEDPDFLNAFIYLFNNLCNHVDEYQKLFKAGVKKIVLNAAENEGEGNVICTLANTHNVLTFNYMNGTKARDPQNSETFFDYWFMPDKKTQDLIMSYKRMSKEQLPITGHLLQELAEKYQYSGSLNNIIDDKFKYKVIALLTSPIFDMEKVEVETFLIKYLKKHNDIIVLVRKHPSEITNEKFIHERIIHLPNFEDKFPDNSLFDLFLKSDVAISFSSMVSYQASWFSIPSFNYELSEKSRLPFVDNEKIFHINNTSLLEIYLEDYLYNGKGIQKSTSNLSASDNIASILINS